MELNNLNDMTAFVASVKSGSFTAAAKQLGLTRSTIGKRIARLEARLNVRLLQRNTRNLAPTDEGRLFYERCTAVLEELENAEQCLAQRSIEPQGRLKISAPLVLGAKPSCRRCWRIFSTAIRKPASNSRSPTTTPT